jgi:hypothetical protein
MICPHCGNEHPEGISYCPKTGARLNVQRACPSCGSELELDWRICPQCGKPIEDDFQTEISDTSAIKKKSNTTYAIVVASLLILIIAGAYLALRYFIPPDASQTAVSRPPTQFLPEDTPAMVTPSPTSTSTDIPDVEIDPVPGDDDSVNGLKATPDNVTSTLQTPETIQPAPTPTATPVIMPQISADRNQVFLGDQLLLDVLKDGPGCFSIDKILSPPTNNYFLVLMACFEGDNDGFLFSMDGKEKHAVTQQFDYINYSNVALSPDGKAFVYERVNSCCHARSDLPSNAPKPGIVLYDVSTHRKLVLVPDVYLTPMQWSLNSAWIAYFFNDSYDPGKKGKLFLVDASGSEIWLLDDTLTGSDCSSLSWEFANQSEDMVLSCISSRDTITKSYPVSGQMNTPPSGSATKVK